MPGNEKFINLYNLLKETGNTKAKDINEFGRWMSGENYRRGLYKNLQRQGVGGIGSDFDEFSRIVGYEQKAGKARAAVTQALNGSQQRQAASGKPAASAGRPAAVPQGTQSPRTTAWNPYEVPDMRPGFQRFQEEYDIMKGQEAAESSNPGNVHVQAARKRGEQAQASRDQRRAQEKSQRYGVKTPQQAEQAKRIDDTFAGIQGDSEAAERAGLPEVNEQLRDQLDYMNATGETLKSPGSLPWNSLHQKTDAEGNPVVDANGNPIMTTEGIIEAPTVARDEQGNIMYGPDGKPLIGRTHESGRVAAYKSGVQQEYEHDLKRQMEEARREREQIERQLKEADKRGQITRSYLGNYNPGQTDPERAALLAALHQNEDRIKSLETQLAGGERSFWRGVLDAAGDVDTWLLGARELQDMGAMIRAAEHQKGGKLTAAERKMLEQTVKNREEQSRMDEKSNWMYRGGRMTTQMVPFMAQIMATGGFSGVADVGATAGRLWAQKFIRKFGYDTFTKRAAAKMLRATGVGIGDIMAGYASANTTGLMNTAADIGHRYLGDVVQDADGGFHFEGGEDLADAIVHGETAQMLEFATERFGEHLPGFGRLVEFVAGKRGLSGLSRIVGRLNNNKFFAKTGQVLGKGGIQGLPAEGIEEEMNIIGNALLTGDQEFSDLWDARTQGDIWGGLALSLGLMHAPAVVTASGAGVYNSAQYHRFKGKTDKSGVVASYRLGKDRWAPLKERIDDSTNEQMRDVIAGIIDDPSLHQEEKRAVLDYAKNLLVMRGYNIGTMNAAKESSGGDEADGAAGGTAAVPQSTQQEEAEATAAEEAEVSAMNARDAGYNAEGDDRHEAFVSLRKAQYEAERALGLSEGGLDEILDDGSGGISWDLLGGWLDSHRSDREAQEKMLDYVNAKSAYDGMMDRVNDEVEAAVDVANEKIDQTVNRQSGLVEEATLRDDRRVHIIDGHVEMLGDGSGVDRGKSSKDIIVRDSDGKVRFADVSEFMQVSPGVDPAGLKAQTAEAVERQIVDDASREIEGKPLFEMQDAVELSDGTQAEVVGVQETAQGRLVTVQVETTQGPRVMQMTQEELEEDTRKVARGGEVIYDSTPRGGVSMPSQQTEEGNAVVADGAAEVPQPTGRPAGEAAGTTAMPQSRGQEDSGNVFMVNEEAVGSLTAEELGEITSINVDYYREHPERVVEEAAGLATATADYLNGNTDARGYLENLGYATGENSWLDSATADEIASEADSKAEKCMRLVRPLLWEGSAVITPSTDAASATVPTLDAQQSGEQSGSASDQSSRLSEHKDSENSGTEQGNEEKSALSRIMDPRRMSDEEKARRGEMLLNAPAIEVAANQIVSTRDLSARKAAEAWWDEHVPAPQYYDTEIGEVEINRNSVESSLAHGYGQAKLDALTSLSDGFGNATYLGTMPDSERRETVNHYFAYPIIYNGTRSYVFCRAIHDNNSNRIYVHEVFVADRIKKGGTLQTAASKPHGGISLYRDILANVLDSASKDSENSGTEQGNEEKSALSRIPVAVDGSGKVRRDRRSGQPVYEWHKATVEDTADAFTELAGGELVVARDAAQAMIDEAEKQLRKARGQKARARGGDPMSYFNSQRQVKAAQEEAQAVLDHWKKVRQEVNHRMGEVSRRRAEAAEAAKSEEQRRQEAAEAARKRAEAEAREQAAIEKAIDEAARRRNKVYEPLAQARQELSDDAEAMAILDDTEPRGLDEWVSALIRPRSIMWNDEQVDDRTVRGVKSELGLGYKDAEKFGSLFARRANGGKPFGEVVDAIYAGLPAALKEQYTDQDVRNTLLGLFQEESVGRMRNLAAEHRIEEARQAHEYMLEREAEAEMAAWAEAYHLEPEERETFEDYMEEMTRRAAEAPLAPEGTYPSLLEGDEEGTAAVPQSTEQENNEQNNGNNERNREQDRGGKGMDREPFAGRETRESAGSRGEVREQDTQHGEAGRTRQADGGEGRMGLPADDVAGGARGVVKGNVPLSNEVNEFDKPFVLSSDGTTTFGEVTEESGLTAAPIKLSLGENVVDEKGANHGYGLLHIEAGHGDQIRAAGFSTVEEFVETVARNYDTIREGNAVANNQTYLLEVSDDHNNTLFVQLSRDGSYWNVNSAGIFRKKYSRRMREVASLPTIGNSSNTETVEVNHGQTKGVTATSENSSLTSAGKGSEKVLDAQGKVEKKVIQGLENYYQVADFVSQHGIIPMFHYGSQKASINLDGGVDAKRTAKRMLQIFKSATDWQDFHDRMASADIGTTINYLTSIKQFFEAYQRGEITDKDVEALFDSSVTLDARGLEKIKRQAVREDGQLLILPSTKEEVGALSDPTDDLSSAGKGSEKSASVQGKGRKNAENQIIKGKTLPPSKTPGQSDVKAGAVASNLSIGKDNTSSSNLQGKGGKNAENQARPPIQGLEGYSEADVLSAIRGDIEEKLADAGIDGVTIKGMALHGSRLRGDAREDSDLDVVVEYEGDMSEDGLFNILNDEPMEIEGVRVDVNPITRGKSGTLDQYMERSRRYDDEKRAKTPNGSVRGAVEAEVQSEGKEAGGMLGATSSSSEIASEEGKVDTEPTDGQKEAGNYRKGHIKVDGYDITIENPKGSVRRGTDANGHRWEVTMNNTYGYIRGTEGVDGDHIDVFLSDHPTEGKVFVVDQVKPAGDAAGTMAFDEHKVMYGFADAAEAMQAYLSNYSPGWKGLGAITGVSREEFKKWIESSHRKTKPFAEYSSVKPLGDTQLDDGAAVVQQHTERTAGMSDEQADVLIETMRVHAARTPVVEITDENWREKFSTPIGEVRMGANQREKLLAKGRGQQYGMLVYTLENPDLVLDEQDKEPNMFHERQSSYLFVKTFQKEDGSKYVHFESVTVSQDGMEVSISSHIIRENQLRNKLKSDRLLYKATALDESAHPSAEQPTNEGVSLSSGGKGSDLFGNAQGNGEKNVSKADAFIHEGEDYVSAAVRIAKEHEVKRTAAHFAEETQEEATAFDKRVPEMDDAELLAYMQEDGKGDVNKAHHPSVYDEYDYRHGDEQLQSYDDTLVRLNESGTTLEQAEEMLANIQKDVARLATEDRAMLLGQEEALQEYIDGLEKVHFDRQGNPVDADGRLILEEIASIDELKGEDFSRPTRNVQLPKIPEKVDKALGAGGKPVIIKKNIFEKNARDHKDLKPSQSREILKTALYSPNLYGQNQKASRPYNYVVVSTKGADGKNKLVLLEVNNGKENVEIVHWHYIRDNALETLKRQAEREGGHILILPSDKPEEAGGLSSRTLDLSSADKDTDLFGNAQGSGKKSSSDGKKSSSDGKIDDVGEVQDALPMEQETPQTEQNERDTTSSTIKENGRLSELRTKYPGRVFGEQHEDGSVTFHDEDAMLVSELLGREFDGEDLTLPKKEADKALQKLLANGHKAGVYGDEYKPKYDEHGNRIEPSTEPQSIGRGVFKYFKGTLKELVELGKKAGNILQKMVLVPTISERLKTDLSSMGIVLDVPYRHTIDNFAIKHTFNEHASEDEKLRGQVPITESDFHLATDVIENYDEISIDKNKRGQHIILYKKRYPDGRIIYVEEVRSPKKGELAFVSMRKYQAKKSGLPNEAEASTLGSSAKISSADSESPVATNQSLAGSATDISAGKVTDLFGNAQGNGEKNVSKADAFIHEGEDYVSAAVRIAKEHEVKRTAAHFAEETQEEATAFDKRVPEMDDAELLAYMQEDGKGDVNKAHHPSVYDEYDYRHGDEQLQSYDDTLVRLNESGTTLEQAEEMLANIHGNMERFATEERPLLLGQEEALQEYIDALKNVEEEKEVAKTSQRTVQQELQSEIGLSEKEQSRLSELKSMGRSNLSRRELDEMLSLERKERILREGSGFDAAFGLKPVSEISSADDIDANIGKIVDGLKRHEGDGTLDVFEGFAYQGAYKKNTGHQVGSYLTVLTGVVPNDILKSWADGHGVKTHNDVLAYGERLYDEAKGDVSEPQPVGKGLFSYFNGTIKELISEAKKKGNALVKKIISPVSSRLQEDLSSQGLEVDGYNHVLDNSAIRHTLKQHGSEDEVKRGQIPITEEDFDRLPDVVENYDDVRVENGKRDNIDNIIYSKSYPDGTTIYVEEKRDKRKELAAVTMWKTKNTTLTDANRDATPISDLSGVVSAGKGTDLFGNEQGKVKKSSSETKIDDVGEVLAGARKDMRREIAKSLANVTEAALVEKPFGKVYKKPDLKKAVESGALREKDAIFYEALFSMVNQQKPKVTQSEMRSKRFIPDFKTKAERWASDTFKQMEVLRQFMELDEAGRDAMMERMLADRYPTRDQELAEIEKRKGWNPDYEGHKYEWGDKTTPNPLWVTYEIMNRLGYNVGDKLDVPYGVVKANTSGTGYSIENLKGERAILFGSGMTLDEAIDRIVYLAKLKRGDADVSHPTQLFAFPATKSESGESGRYRVMWGRDYKTREFDSREDADAFAQTKSGAYVSPIMETKRRFGYKVRFTHPLTGEKMFVDDTEFDTKEEAQAYFDGNFEKLNEATNAKLQEEREKKGEKKTLTADDVVHVTMVHSGKGGWTHAVVIDKKYANNDGQVRIIKEGFASRKDAKSFADSVKDDVLKTVLKHKEDAKKIVYFDTGENSRIGEDYRNGKDVDAEDFMNTFGFRGVQFGNWTNQADRQMAVNQAYDAFMDMARLIGVSPKAMSLNGELGIAFGARGVGGFAAHYEPGEVVINLTKTQGAGSLAHEWWHALDNYFARRAGSAGDMVTDNRRIEMRDALRKAFNDMLDLVNGSDYAQRSAAKGEYWGRTHEITARLLAEWVDRELKKRGELNTFLSRGAVVERGQQHNYDVYEVLERLAGREPMPFEDYKELPESLKGIPYPSAKEVEQFGGSLRHIFDTLEEQVDEETGNVALLHKATSGVQATELTEREVALRDALVATMRDAGIEVNVSAEEGQRVLDMVNGEAKLMGSRTNKKMANIGEALEGRELTEQQQKVVDVFRGKSDNTPIEVERADGKVRVIMRQGNDEKAGTKHSLYGHYGTNKGVITDEDILIIPDVLARGDRTPKMRGNTQLYEYTLNGENGTRYTVLTEKKHSREEFADFYTNKKTSQSARKTRSEEARDIDNNDVSSAKLQQNSDTSKEMSGKIREHRVYHDSGADFDAFDHSHKVKFFRTRDGKAFGYTYNGKMYIDPGIATSETPVHEYAHLWAEALRRSDPQLWEEIKGVLLHDEAVKPFIDKVRKEYPEVKNEDDLLDEVLAQYSGKRGAERLRKAAEEIAGENPTLDARALARAAMAKVKSVLEKFWRSVAKVFGWKYSSAAEIADKVLSDLLSGVNPNKEKALDYLHFSESSISEASNNQELNSAAKIVENFENPKYSEENLRGRDAVEFEDGDRLALEGSDGGYRVYGLSGEYETKERLLDAFRDKYEGYVARLSDDGDVLIVEPWSKYLAPQGAEVGMVSTVPVRTRGRRKAQESSEKEREAYLERKTRNAQAAVQALADKLGLAVEVRTDTRGLTGRRARAKGWYDVKTGKIVVILPNHRSQQDVMRTLLHEGVAHHGLRELFGERFDDFLRNVYDNASVEVRSRINRLLPKYGYNHLVATEEYLAGLAEDTDFEHAVDSGWWGKIKEFFLRMLSEAGVKLNRALTDNELRYVLWRSWKNLEERQALDANNGIRPVVAGTAAVPQSTGRERSVLQVAEDISVQNRLGVGNFRKEHTKYTDRDVVTVMPHSTGLSDYAAKYVGTSSGVELSDSAKGALLDLYHSIKEQRPEAIGMVKIRGNYYMINRDARAMRDLVPRVDDGNPYVVIAGNGLDVVLTSLVRMGYVVGIQEMSDGVVAGEDAVLTEWHGMQEGTGEEAETTGEGRGGIYFRDGDESWSERDRSIARAHYEERVKSSSYQFREAVQDSMLGLKEAMEAILKGEKTANGTKTDAFRIEEVPGFENAYLAENRMSSVSQAQQEDYYRRRMKPLLSAIAKICGKDEAKRDELKDYLMAKHGLERNRVMAESEAQKEHEEKMAKLKKQLENGMMTKEEREKLEWRIQIEQAKYDGIRHHMGNPVVRTWYDACMKQLHAMQANGTLGSRDYQKEMAHWQELYDNGEKAKYRDKDYAGLTGLMSSREGASQNDEEMTVAEAERLAEDFVTAYESAHDTKDLWKRINEATDETLLGQYRAGIISRETLDDIKKMYKNYVPLRGWDETTSDEVYGYLFSDDGPVKGSIMKKAEGRQSKADDPIATIAAMADDGIRQSNRNLMKQMFLNFVLNHPSDLVSVSALWVKYDETEDTWTPVFPDLLATDTAEQVEAKVNAFEARMKELHEENPDKYKRGKEATNIPYKVVKGNLKEHQVLVKRGGQTYVLTINGNPRAAQALNGLTNPDVEQGGYIGNLLKAGEWVNHQLSAFYTTRNPDFVVSNFLRDMLYSNCMTWVKEDAGYALRFHKNFGKVNPVVMARLFHEWEQGEEASAPSSGSQSQGMDYLRSMFRDFMLNGGETGYTNVKDLEGHKRAVAAELKRQTSRWKKAMTLLGMQMDLLNRSVENCARFAAFVTSREMGRSLERSIYDAKEVSVNFNKKGSGGKFVNAKGQTHLGKFGSYLSGIGRLLFVFWNAGVQGMTNFGRNAKRNPKKFIPGAAAMFSLGFLIPILNEMLGGGGDDDDKNAYYNLPEYVRRSNICLRVGGQYVTIPLPIEYRAMYGLGELGYSVLSKNERYGNAEMAAQFASQLSQILPLDFLEGGGGFHPFIPSIAKPLAEAYFYNKSWSGLPIYKDTYFNQSDPEWTKAYSSANRQLVGASKMLNEMTGGDEYSKGVIDINPSKLEYVLKGYFGGYISTADRLVKAGEEIAGVREPDWRNWLIVNRVLRNGDERTANRKTQKEYFRFLEEYEKTSKRERGYKSQADQGSSEYAKKLEELYRSDAYARMRIFKELDKEIKASREEAKESATKEERDFHESEMYALMRYLVDVLRGKENR